MKRNNYFLKKILSKGLAEKMLRRGYRIDHIEENIKGKEVYFFIAEGNFFIDFDKEIEEFRKITSREVM